MKIKFVLTIISILLFIVLTTAAQALDYNVQITARTGSAEWGAYKLVQNVPGPLVEWSWLHDYWTEGGTVYYGQDSAYVNASVDNLGIHSSIGCNERAQYREAQASTDVVLNNEFIVVPNAGFTGSKVRVEIPYEIKGVITNQAGNTFNLSCSGLDCSFWQTATAYISVTADMTNVLSENGVGVIKKSGVVTYALDPNKVYTLYSSLSLRNFCTAYSFANDVGGAVLFPATFSYTGSSPDGVIEWGLTPRKVVSGDVNGDSFVDLTDSVKALQILAGMNLTLPNIGLKADTNGDSKIGMADAIYILQKIAGMR